jgi:hypothetical protein
VTRRAPPRTIHYPVAAAVVRRVKKDSLRPWRPVEEVLELDEGDPEDSRWYSQMVAGGWLALTLGFTVAMIPVSYAVSLLLGEQAGLVVLAAFAAVTFFCLAGVANAFWHMGWHVWRARRCLQNHRADSEAFRKAMRRSLPGNTSLLFQVPVAIVAFVLSL